MSDREARIAEIEKLLDESNRDRVVGGGDGLPYRAEEKLRKELTELRKQDTN